MQDTPAPGSPKYTRILLPLFCVLIFAVALSLLPSQLSEANFGADGGDLLAAILRGGVPHPTGYPTYVLLGMLFQRISWGSPYFRGALLSALPAALAVGLLAVWMLRLPAGRGALLPAWTAAVAWGVSPLLLSQAVIVEVHGLQALFTMLALVWAWLLLREPVARGRVYLLAIFALLFGLGLGNHLTLLLFTPAIALALWSAWRRGLPTRWVLAQIASLLLGMLVYIYLPLSARGNPPVNWGDPQTWQGFLWVVSGGPYRDLVLGGSMDALPGRALAWFSLVRQQYGMPGFVLGVAGIVLSSQDDRRLFRLLGWVFLSYSLLVLTYHTADAAVYLIPATLVWAVWVGTALHGAWDARWRAVPWGRLLCLGMVAYLMLRFPQVYRQVDPRQETRSAEFAQQLLQAAPARALVLTQSDPDTFSLWYHHFGLGERPDIAVVSIPLMDYGWYRESLSYTYPQLNLPAMAQDGEISWAEQIALHNPDRPTCRTALSNPQPLILTYQCQE